MACLDALNTVHLAGQKCLFAGHLLAEWKAKCPHGNFLRIRKQAIPEISPDTAERWMRAAANVLKALPPPPLVEEAREVARNLEVSPPRPSPPEEEKATCDIEVEIISISEMLTRSPDELPAPARAWRQAWLDLTERKSIKDCLGGVLVDGDEDHRIVRAINGATKGGKGGDRKDFALHAAMKLRHLGTHLSHWESTTETQRTEIKTLITAAILGDEAKLRGRHVETITFSAWPAEVCRTVQEAIRERLKGSRP